MANITIPNLPQAVSIDGAEQLLGVQSGTSKSITTGQIVSLANGGGSLPFPVSIGGTGNTTFDNYGVLYGDGTNPVESITPPTGSNYVLVASPGTVPAWQENIPVTAGVNSISFDSTGLTPNTATEGIVTVAGTLVAANGGTGQSSYTIGDLLYASSTTALSKLADVATGSVLISGGVGAAPSYSASPTLTTSLTTPLLIGGTTASSSLTLQSTSGVGTTDSIALKVGNNGATTAMTINTSGNVGIGTTAPTSPLNTYAAVNALSVQYVATNQNGASPTAAIGFNVSTAGETTAACAKGGIGFTRTAAFGGGYMSFYNNNSGAAGNFTTADEKMRITSTGNVGIGSTSLTDVSLRVSKNITGATTFYGVFSDGAIQSDVTANAYYYGTSASAVSGTLSTLRHYHARQASLGTATVAIQYGFVTDDSLIGATNNYAFIAGNTTAVTAGKTAYGFYSAVNTATGGGTTYGFYAAGTAENYFNGAVTLGTPLAVSSGGTGATTSNAALTNLTEFTTTATAAGTTVLTNTSTYFQYFTGATTQTITLPVTSTLGLGWSFHIVNNSTGNLTVNSSGGNLLITVLPGLTVMCTCIGTALTTAADWEAGYTDFTTATGTGSVVLSASPTLTGTTTATTVSATTLTATAGAGFQNIDFLTSGASWSLPAALQVAGAKFKVTVIGAGGGGGGNPATAATAGGGGGAGGVAVAVLTYVSGQNSVTTSFGTAGAGTSGAAGGAGTSTTATYNSLTYIGTGGGGGALGAATSAGGAGGTGTTGTGTENITLTGQSGGAGGTTTAVAGVTYLNNSGGNTPLGYGMGGKMPFNGAAGSAGISPTNYGAGGSGSVAGSTAAAKAGASGAPGAIIIEY